MSDVEDQGDALRAAFDNYQRPKCDVVPHDRGSVEHTAELLHGLAGTTVEVTHYELTEAGITKIVERVEVCAPITTTEDSENL